jgi:quinolinate synthase
MNNNNTIVKGFVDSPIPTGTNLVAEINKMKKEKNAIILGHYYITSELQDISDFIGDSLALAQKAATTEADMIVFLGVHFMAETAKILCPGKKVIIPDLNAGCSLADSCNPVLFEQFIKDHPGHTVITYVNATAKIKTLSDVICTSSNARQIVESFPPETKLIFAPDWNLGNYINSQTGRNMVLWNGACHVHHQFSLPKLIELKKENPDAKVLAHPECNAAILLVSDYIGSTAALLKYSQSDNNQKYIVATESGIIYQMRKASPQKTFIPAPPEDSTCACNDCNFMKLNTLEKLYNALKFEMPEIDLDSETIKRAYLPIRQMLDISAKLGL